MKKRQLMPQVILRISAYQARYSTKVHCWRWKHVSDYFLQGSIDTDVKSSINSVIEDLTEMIEVAEDLTEDEEELKTLELGSVEKQFLENMESFNNLNEALQSLSSQNDKASKFRLYQFTLCMALILSYNNIFKCFVFRLQVIRRLMVAATIL